MSLETAIQNLADAINAHAAAIVASAISDKSGEIAALAAAGADKAKRGRPAKNTTEPATPEAPPPAPVVAAAPAAAAPVSSPPVAAAVAAPSEADVKKALIAVVTKVGKEACTALCVRHGSASGNFSGLDKAVWATVIADANALVEATAAI